MNHNKDKIFYLNSLLDQELQLLQQQAQESNIIKQQPTQFGQELAQLQSKLANIDQKINSQVQDSFQQNNLTNNSKFNDFDIGNTQSSKKQRRFQEQDSIQYSPIPKNLNQDSSEKSKLLLQDKTNEKNKSKSSFQSKGHNILKSNTRNNNFLIESSENLRPVLSNQDRESKYQIRSNSNKTQKNMNKHKNNKSQKSDSQKSEKSNKSSRIRESSQMNQIYDKYSRLETQYKQDNLELKKLKAENDDLEQKLQALETKISTLQSKVNKDTGLQAYKRLQANFSQSEQIRCEQKKLIAKLKQQLNIIK